MDWLPNPEPADVRTQFVCPIDNYPLQPAIQALACPHCATLFPVVNGVPILINDRNSVFRIADYTSEAAYAGASGYGGSVDHISGWRRAYRRFAMRLSEADVPGVSRVNAPEYIRSRLPDAKILVVGAGERRYKQPGITYTDVTFAAGVSCICDAHDLPFADESFDAVFANSVLEHVCDPQRCAAEMTRVLKRGGYIMAITPFLQPVHMGAYDFTRFTYLGHRRLFRWFDDIDSGMFGGAFYSVLHLTRALAISLTDQPRLRSILRLAALLVTYPLRHFDRVLPRTQGAYNAACATYFFGRKRESPIPDREILALFRGR